MLFVTDGCHGDDLASSAEDWGCGGEMSHRHGHRWGPIGSKVTFYAGVQAEKDRRKWIVRTIGYRGENVQGHVAM